VEGEQEEGEQEEGMLKANAVNEVEEQRTDQLVGWGERVVH
jgi:hypothetical protein